MNIPIYVPFLIFYYYFKKISFDNLQLSKIGIILGLCCLSFLSAIAVKKYLVALYVLEGTDAYYLSKNEDNSLLGSVVIFIPLIFIFALWVFCGKIKLSSNNKLHTLAVMVVYDAIVTPAAVVLGMWRVSEFFCLPRIMFLSYLIPIFIKKFKKNIHPMLQALFTLLFLGWMIYRILREWEPCGLMPYKTILFG